MVFKKKEPTQPVGPFIPETKHNPPTPTNQPISIDQPSSNPNAVITTMGIYKNQNGWRFVCLTTQGDKVLTRHETDHDTLRSFCFDEFKIKAVKEFLKEV